MVFPGICVAPVFQTEALNLAWKYGIGLAMCIFGVNTFKTAPPLSPTTVVVLAAARLLQYRNHAQTLVCSIDHGLTSGQNLTARVK